MCLTKKQFREIKSVHRVDVPELGEPGFTYVRMVKASERRELLLTEKVTDSHLACMCLSDADANPIFDFPDDVPQLDDLPFAILTRIANACVKHNFIDESSVDEAEKNEKRSTPAL